MPLAAGEILPNGIILGTKGTMQWGRAPDIAIRQVIDALTHYHRHHIVPLVETFYVSSFIEPGQGCMVPATHALVVRILHGACRLSAGETKHDMYPGHWAYVPSGYSSWLDNIAQAAHFQFASMDLITQ